MKIVIRMAAGLANRMSQYAYALYLKDQGYEVYVDNHYKAKKLKTEDVVWDNIFPNAPIRQASSGLIFKLGGGYDLVSKVRRHYLNCSRSVYFAPDMFSGLPENLLHKSRYVIGVFLNVSFIERIRDLLVRTFQFLPFKDEINIELSDKFQHENSVAIHIRKGKDYSLNEIYSNCCDLEYYKAAIKIIKEKIDNPRFYVFTDNPEWVHRNLMEELDYTLIDWNPTIGWGNHFDMQLMSLCKHNIIANSTYSWWGAFLNSNPEKIVIAPRYWFNKKYEKYKNASQFTICNGWIAI